MAYSGIDIVQTLGQKNASGHLVIASALSRVEIWIRDGKIINLAGCGQSDLLHRLSDPDPFVLLNPLFSNVEPTMSFDIPVLLSSQVAATSPLPPVAQVALPPASVLATNEHPEAKKISNRLKRQTIDATEVDDPTPPERTYRRLLFPARQAVSITLGRSSECEVTCLNATVSRKHCMLDFDGVLFTAHDLGSRNGTYLNKERVITGRAGRKAMLSLGTDHYLLDWED
jgi:hypothetical protein